jgi:Uma2 family endonuclease
MNVLESWAEPRPVKLTATDFLQLAEAGALDAYKKTELIDGVIVAMSPAHSRHGFVQGEFYVRLALALRATFPQLRAALETSVRISSQNVPQADMLVSNYRGPRTLLSAATIQLVVEIADTTGDYDRGTKARIYAAGNIPEYWVVDIEAQEVARFWAPGPDGYARHDAVSFGEPVSAMTLAGLTVGTDELLG